MSQSYADKGDYFRLKHLLLLPWACILGSYANAMPLIKSKIVCSSYSNKIHRQGLFFFSYVCQITCLYFQ